jgi:acyl-coenzyme A synthetase/AMP-(fatty) acid ligase
VRAYVTLAEGAERPAVANLIVHCRERIGYKAPEEIVFLDEMPLNPTGKIDRRSEVSSGRPPPPALEFAVIVG